MATGANTIDKLPPPPPPTADRYGDWRDYRLTSAGEMTAHAEARALQNLHMAGLLIEGSWRSDVSLLASDMALRKAADADTLPLNAEPVPVWQPNFTRN